MTLEHIAQSISDRRRCLLFAWPDTAASIARRLDECPECMRSFSGEDGAHRLYNANGDVRAGPNEIKVYRPAGGQTVWLTHEGRPGVELRDSDSETLATFDDPEDVFTDPTVYPATETDITDFSEWTPIKRPALPGRIDRDMVDVLAVTDDDLEVLEPSGDRTPITELPEESDDKKPGKILVDDLRR
ncbi:hypothetical protein HAPAU_41180 [Halalkalicoccus paucihalophilus]|uniref:Uncharacterized protein n=1 Tax=Halalkalicoccus paucihalophilus TaxID=1008153 RepID=A0A151A8U3_9EURY|nr:hypothetical protein [Halalkalicoccus paucihalophilus]KYH24039.1 hypothetical protein HAPAU_41180 [Halalkalicoccus paucihalophilus]